MQRVELEAGGAVDVGLDRLDRLEVPGDVEHHAAVGEARGVVDRDRRDAPAVAVAGDQLPERLDAVEEARRVGAGDDDGCLVRGEPVRLRLPGPGRRVDAQVDRALAGSVGVR